MAKGWLVSTSAKKDLKPSLDKAYRPSSLTFKHSTCWTSSDADCTSRVGEVPPLAANHPRENNHDDFHRTALVLPCQVSSHHTTHEKAEVDRVIILTGQHCDTSLHSARPVLDPWPDDHKDFFETIAGEIFNEAEWPARLLTISSSKAPLERNRSNQTLPFN